MAPRIGMPSRNDNLFDVPPDKDEENFDLNVSGNEEDDDGVRFGRSKKKGGPRATGSNVDTGSSKSQAAGSGNSQGKATSHVTLEQITKFMKVTPRNATAEELINFVRDAQLLITDLQHEVQALRDHAEGAPPLCQSCGSKIKKTEDENLTIDERQLLVKIGDVARNYVLQMRPWASREVIALLNSPHILIVDPEDTATRYLNEVNERNALAKEMLLFLPGRLAPKLAVKRNIEEFVRTGNAHKSHLMDKVRTARKAILSHIPNNENQKVLDKLGGSKDELFVPAVFPPGWARNVKDKNNLEKIFQQEALPKIIRVLVYGPHSLKPKHVPSPMSNGVIWNVKAVTFGLICFAACAFRHLISEETKFEANWIPTFDAYYMFFLDNHKKQAVEDLVMSYNRFVFKGTPYAPKAKGADAAGKAPNTEISPVERMRLVNWSILDRPSGLDSGNPSDGYHSGDEVSDSNHGDEISNDTLGNKGGTEDNNDNDSDNAAVGNAGVDAVSEVFAATSLGEKDLEEVVFGYDDPLAHSQDPNGYDFIWIDNMKVQEPSGSQPGVAQVPTLDKRGGPSIEVATKVPEVPDPSTDPIAWARARPPNRLDKGKGRAKALQEVDVAATADEVDDDSQVAVPRPRVTRAQRGRGRGRGRGRAHGAVADAS
ncbi:hypothetical protein C8Q80DRAFT_1265976 [Daedaleopsis nitida]|nr:hypothetical protein C8Q80DRAFT_1265976 [Daedaleopsis nitida]